MFERTKNMIRRWTDSSGVETLEDKRVHPRYEIEVETICRPALPNAPSIVAKVRNLSRGGINLRLEKPLEEGELICIDLPRRDNDSTITVLACVMHVVPLPDGHYAHGCTFSAELDETDLQLFGARKKLADPKDQRTWTRFPTQGEVSYQKVLGDPALVGRGKMTNISPGGIGIIAEQLVEPGTVLRLELHRRDNSSDVSILACVVYLGEESEDGWLLGCNFIHELSSHDLDSLI